MAHRRSDEEMIRDVHNTARFFVEKRHIAWVLLIATLAWGVYGYTKMPKRKDPDIPTRTAVAITPWPGVGAEKVEQLVTRAVEARIAENTSIHPAEAGTFGIKSLSLPGVSFVSVQLDENQPDIRKEFNDIAIKLNALNESLPDGAGPIQFNSNYGDTAALMLTVADPPESPTVIALRAEAVAGAITEVRARLPASPAPRVALVVAFSPLVDANILLRMRDLALRYLVDARVARDAHPFQGSGFVGIDLIAEHEDAKLISAVGAFMQERLGVTRFHPDAWAVAAIRDPRDAEARLRAVAGFRYTYRELDDVTDLIQRTLQQVPQVSAVHRSGVLPEQVYLEYSQAKLASYGVQPAGIRNLLASRNTALPGGVLTADERNVTLDPTGEFKSQDEIGGVIMTTDSAGRAVYLRDLVDTVRSYQNPPGFLNYYSWRDAAGTWHRGPAITLAIQMRAHEQIADFGRAVDTALARLGPQLPPDIILSRTSDQPRQVRENIDLLMTALYEAIALVVLAALIGFWEWRSALLIALSIPITLAMTFGMAFALGIELQQVSIATLIIALGLLVDDPVVAADAIKRDLAIGHPRIVSSWLGPTKLARAILFSTLTNIVAYLPFLLLTGTNGEFLRSLPIVMTCALVASRLASMTFVPLLGYYLLRPPALLEAPIEERRGRGLTGYYYRLGVRMLEHRWLSCAGSLVFLAAGLFFVLRLPTSFFPYDLQYLSYVDLWLPNNVSLARTDEVAARAAEVIQQVAADFARERAKPGSAPRPALKSITTFVGGGGPRFWYSLSPEQRQQNYAQLVIEVEDREDTVPLVARLQPALAAAVDGARADVRQLETNAVGVPIQVQITGGEDTDVRQSAAEIATLRKAAERVKEIFRAIPLAAGFRDDWEQESFVVKVNVDPDRANLVGISNQDVAASAAAGISGIRVASLREGDRQIPVVTRLRLEDRARLADVESLYVWASQGRQRTPLTMVASTGYALETQRIRRLEHFRTITVQGFPAVHGYSSEVMSAARPALMAVARDLPPGYRLIIAGSEAKQRQGFGQLTLILIISVIAIFITLVVQFNHVVKPLLVFAAVPYGAVGALAGLWIMGAPFGFMAFLGIVSLVGVIVSHVIVLFDFIEQNHEEGKPLQESLLDAGIVRLRPVAITVLSTALGLVPLAVHGGPLWEALCYAQIGGLALATFIELLLVKVFYAVFVLDLGIVGWHGAVSSDGHAPAGTPASHP